VESFLVKPTWGVMVTRTMMGFRTEVTPVALRLRRLARTEATTGWEAVFIKVEAPPLTPEATDGQKTAALSALLAATAQTPVTAGWMTAGKVSGVSDATCEMLLKKTFPKAPSSAPWLLDQSTKPFAIKLCADKLPGGMALLFVAPAVYVRMLAWTAPTIAADSM
jgi:hypothetical protein